MIRSLVAVKVVSDNLLIKEDALESALADGVVLDDLDAHPLNKATTNKLLTNFFNIVILSNDMRSNIIRICLTAVFIKVKTVPDKIISDFTTAVFH